MAVAPEFVAVKEVMFPVPEAAKPIAGLVLVQVKLPPVGTLTKAVAGIKVPLQKVAFEGTETVGIGFTVMVKVICGPVHIPSLAVTEIVAVIGVEPVFVDVKDGRLPLPEVANPIAGLVFVQA